MWLRVTMIYLWDIWYDTHKKWREELVGYYGSLFVLMYGILLTSNISRSQPRNKATEQCNLTKNQPNITSFVFIFYQTPIRARHPPTPLLQQQRIHMDKRHGMEWVPQWRGYHTKLRDGLFDGLHSGVPIHVVNTQQNQLNCVTWISFATKYLTELQLGSKYFDRNSPLRYCEAWLTQVALYFSQPQN